MHDRVRSSRHVLAAAYAVGLLSLAGCGGQSHENSNRSQEGSRPPDTAPATFGNTDQSLEQALYPDYWIALSEKALDEEEDLGARKEAVRKMSLAGPRANLVLPALTELEAEGPPCLRDLARASRGALLQQRSKGLR